MSNSSNHIFISYSRRDEEDAAALEKALRAAGYVVWCDETSISAGEEPISELLNTAISDAAMVVLLISESWLSSEYAQRELNSAISAGKTVLPILLGSTDVSSLPSSIAHLQVGHASDGILAALPEVMSAHEYQEVPKTPIGPGPCLSTPVAGSLLLPRCRPHAGGASTRSAVPPGSIMQNSHLGYLHDGPAHVERDAAGGPGPGLSAVAKARKRAWNARAASENWG
ncbi:MAG: toll/interleukin-1 receptor domain-containing protein [Planctomycetota bacterium]